MLWLYSWSECSSFTSADIIYLVSYVSKEGASPQPREAVPGYAAAPACVAGDLKRRAAHWLQYADRLF